MEFFQNVLNFITIPIIIALICIVLPPYLIMKVVSFIIRSFFVEDVKGKVVLITGASSGIGEQLAYEYAKKGACLALAARREDRLRMVADKALELGSPDVLVLAVDVSIVDHSRRMVKRTIDHFQRVDHVVINAGIGSMSPFEDYLDVASMRPIMDVNFWGSAYAAKFAIPHLRKTKGKMIIISSIAWWSPTSRLAFYNASKAAMTSLFETIRVEIGHEIKLTVAILGFIQTEITKHGKSLDEKGSLVHNDNLRDFLKWSRIPMGRADGCAKAIVKSACRGDWYLTYPFWMQIPYFCNLLCPHLYHAVLRLSNLGWNDYVMSQ